MKALVTGATGFIGSHLVKALLERGDEVLIITGNRPEEVPKGAEYLCLNFNGVDWGAIPPVDVVFHQAANNNTTDTDTRRMMQANYFGPWDLFKACQMNGCNRFVYASSTAVYGNSPTPWKETQNPTPLNPYGQSKAYFDEWAINVFAQGSGISVVGLRYCNVYGPGEYHKGPRRSMVSQMLEKFPYLKLFKHGEQKREWIYVKDVVRANLLAAEFNGREIFNCGTGNPVTFNEIAHTIAEIKGEPADIEYIDNPYEDKYQTHVETDMNKADVVLGFKPEYDLEKGLRDYVSR